MKKLGFIIKYASNGSGTIAECNSDTGSWRTSVTDTRDFLKYFEDLTDQDIITFTLFDKEGSFLVQQKPISGKGGDYRSAWLYIPNILVISADEIHKAYSFARKALCTPNLHDVVDEANEFFSKSYPEKVGSTFVRSEGGKCAYRILDKMYSFDEILHKGLYQNSYKGYKAIFLLENNIAKRISSIGVSLLDDMTKSKIKKLCSLTITDDCKYLKGGSLVYSRDKRNIDPLSQSSSFDEGDTIYVFAKRDGFEDIQLEPITLFEEDTVIHLNKPLDWRKRILPSSFDVLSSETNKKIEGARIKVNGKDLDGKGVILSEEDCLKVSYEVNADGFETKKSTHPVNILNATVRVEMVRANVSLSCDIILKNNHKARLTLESKYLCKTDRYDHLLKGYSYDSFDKVLFPSGGKKWLERAIGFGYAIICIVVICIGVAINDFFDYYDLKFGWPPYEKIHVDYAANVSNDNTMDGDSLVDLAIGYMNEHPQWCQDDLEVFESAKGIFDMINNYRFGELSKVQKFDSCQRFYQIKTVASRMDSCGYSISGIYSNDHTITIDKWIEKVIEVYEEREKKNIDDVSIHVDNNNPTNGNSGFVQPQNGSKIKDVKNKNNLNENTKAESAQKSSEKKNSTSNIKRGGAS